MKISSHSNQLYLESPKQQKTVEEALYNLTNIVALVPQSSSSQRVADSKQGRTLFTRTIDKVFKAGRSYLPFTYHSLITLSAFCLYIYTRVVIFTIRFVNRFNPNEQYIWPHLPVPCILAVWHGCLPSLLVALVAHKLPAPVTMMISKEPRGDFLTILCHLLGLQVIRGSSREGGWLAINGLVHELEQGACVVIAPDGGGPAGIVKVGAVALASATGLPLVAVGADCSPAIIASRKWDKAHTPIPFSRISISIITMPKLPVFTDLDLINNACQLLQCSLNDATSRAKL